MAKDRKNKKHNPVRIKSIMNTTKYGHYCIVRVVDANAKSDSGCYLYDFKNKKLGTVSLKTEKAIRETRYLWSLVLGIGLKESNGKTKMFQEYVDAPFHVIQDQLIDSLNDKHQAFIAEHSKLRDLMCSFGWIAFIHPDKIPAESVVDEIFEDFGIFKYPSYRELQSPVKMEDLI